MAEKKEAEIDIFKSSMVPKHELLTEDQKQKLLKTLGVSLRHLPKIKEDDAVIKRLAAKHGDVIKITRNSSVAGEYIYYRAVV